MSTMTGDMDLYISIDITMVPILANLDVTQTDNRVLEQLSYK